MENGKRRTERVKWRTNQFSVLLLVLLFSSCSKPQIDLFADYKEIPVIYGMLDVNADTNFIKITRAFGSTNEDPIDPMEVALIYDSCNYPGKLNAYIEELKSSQGQPYLPTGRQIPLDTITIHNKEAGAFYSPDQILYYTTEQFNTNIGSSKYRYKLNVIIPNGDTVTATTGIVDAAVEVVTPSLYFQSALNNNMSPLTFSASEEGSLYEIIMQFNYLEEHAGQPITQKQVSWSYGIRGLSGYEKVPGTENYYRLYYDVNTLFTYLRTAIGNDTVWDVNNPNVTRYMDDFVVSIAAAGEDYSHYYQTTQPTFTLAPEYSNIQGGWGLFSSRIVVHNVVALSTRTKYDLFLEPWGFREQ